MAPRKPPSFRSQLLGSLLREHREAAGLTLSQAGYDVQRDQSTMSRMESGQQPIRVPELRMLLDLYGMTDEKQRKALEGICRDLFVRDWWDDFANVLSPWLLDFPWIEERSRTIRSYDAMVPTGLLQTREYAEASIRSVNRESDAWIVKALDFRMRRQRVLGQKRPPELSVVLDESVLHRPIGGPEVTRAQLQHLAEMAKLPNVEIHVLPFSVGGHPGLPGPFMVFDLPDLVSDIAWTDTLTGMLYVELNRVQQYRRAYDDLCVSALPPEASRFRILEAASQMR
jgi:transcriptional regulator with XRE-family HTH domain